MGAVEPLQLYSLYTLQLYNALHSTTSTKTLCVQHAKHFNKWQRVRIFDGWRAVGPPIYAARPAIRSEPPARQLSRVYTTAQRESDPFPIWIDIALHDIHIFRRLTNCCWLLQGIADREPGRSCRRWRTVRTVGRQRCANT